MRRIAFLGVASLALSIASLRRRRRARPSRSARPVDTRHGLPVPGHGHRHRNDRSNRTRAGSLRGRRRRADRHPEQLLQTVSSIPLSAENEPLRVRERRDLQPREPPIPSRVRSAHEEHSGKERPRIKRANHVRRESRAMRLPRPRGEPQGVDFTAGILINGFGAQRRCRSPAMRGRRRGSRASPLRHLPTGSGVVNFSPALPPGGSTYFSLESPPGRAASAAPRRSARRSRAAGSSGASISVLQGTAVTDTRPWAEPAQPAATGPVSFNVYSDPACKTLVAAAGTAKLAGGTAGPSAAVSTLAPGKYYWQAHYSGSLSAQSATSACGGEILTVLAPTATSTTPDRAAASSGASITGARGHAASPTKRRSRGRCAASADRHRLLRPLQGQANARSPRAAGSSAAVVTAGVATARRRR